MAHVDLLLAFGWPGGPEWIVLLILGLLIFGKRLPEVGRSIGKGIVEFKRGIKGIEDDIDDESSQPNRRAESLPESGNHDLPEQTATKSTAGASTTPQS